nr:hypothetical protein [Pseudactinotalea sp. HY160]
MPPLVLGRVGAGATVPVHVPDGAHVLLRAELEQGGQALLAQVEDWTPAELVDGARLGRARFSLVGVPAGWHELVATIDHAGELSTARAPVIVAPEPDGLEAAVVRAGGEGPEAPPGRGEQAAIHRPPRFGRQEYGGRGWGLSLDLHAVRSARSWGIGDWADLADLAVVAARAGADFLQLNPPVARLAPAGHTDPAASADPADPAARVAAGSPADSADPADPADPADRVAAGGASDSAESARMGGSGLPRGPFPDPIHIRPEDIREVAYLPGAQRTLVEWGTEAVRPWNTDAAAIDPAAAWEAKRSALETIYAAGRSAAREEAFAVFRERGGQLLAEHARACVEAAGTPEAGTDSPERFYTWLAWIGTEQAARAQRAARIAGMTIGILAPVDLEAARAATWCTLDPSLRWAHWIRTAGRTCGGLFVHLPADTGIDRPLHPALAESELTDVGSLIAAAAAGNRLLVLDEPATGRADAREARDDQTDGPAPGPAGGPADGSAAGSEADAARELAGEFWRTARVWDLGPAQLPTTTLASVVVDTIPSAGFLAGEHLDLADRLGLLEDLPGARLAVQSRRERTLTALREQYLLPLEATEREVIEALYRALVRTPARLVSVALADAVGERRPQSMPDPAGGYPSGRLPLADGSGRAVLVDDVPGSVRFTSLVGAIAADLRELAGEPAGGAGR